MNFGIVALMGFLFYVTPRLARPGLLFGVTVDPAFARGEAARRIMCRYGIEIVAHSAVALALMFALGPLAGICWLVFGSGWAFANAHRAAMPYASNIENAIREAGLESEPEDSLFATILALAPLALLCMLAWYARSHWDQIPDPVPVHFGLRGPDRWVARNPSAVYGMIGVIGLLCAMMLLIRYGVRHWSRRVAIEGPAAQAETRFRRLVSGLLIAVEYLMVTIAWVALFATAQGAVILGIATVVLAVFLIFVLLRAGQGGNRMAPGGPVGDRTPDACWKWGMFYINPCDPALFVEKRFGIGYTVNLGNRWSWIFLVITLLPLILVNFYLR